MPVYCSPTALQRLFHHDGERAVAAAADRFGTMFGVSSLGTISLEEARRISKAPQAYQFYFHKDRGLNREMMARAKQAGVEVMMLTVDSITGGNRERDKRGPEQELLLMTRLGRTEWQPFKTKLQELPVT
jgi:L-lactate dehydrogenase (cytochrome)